MTKEYKKILVYYLLIESRVLDRTPDHEQQRMAGYNHNHRYGLDAVDTAQAQLIRSDADQLLQVLCISSCCKNVNRPL